MRAIQIQRLGMLPSLSQRYTALSILASPRIQAQTVTSRPSLFGSRCFSSLSRFGESLEQLAFTNKLRNLSLPGNRDGRTSPIVEPLRPIVFPEQPEMELTRVLWHTSGLKRQTLSLFGKGTIHITKHRNDYKIRWDPNPKAAAQQPNISERLLITRTETLAKALQQGTEWAEVHLPQEANHLSTDAAWLKHPATEKQFDLFYKLNGYGESGRPDDMIVNDKLITVRDVTKGQMRGFIAAALYGRWT